MADPVGHDEERKTSDPVGLDERRKMADPVGHDGGVFPTGNPKSFPT